MMSLPTRDAPPIPKVPQSELRSAVTTQPGHPHPEVPLGAIWQGGRYRPRFAVMERASSMLGAMSGDRSASVVAVLAVSAAHLHMKVGNLETPR